MVIPVFARNQRSYDCHGWIRVRHTLLSRRKSWYMKLLGSTITLHETIDKRVELEYSVTYCEIVDRLRRKSFTIKFSNGEALRIHCFSKEEARKWKRALQRAATLSFANEFELNGEIEQHGRSSFFDAVHRGKKTKHTVQRISKDALLWNYAEQNRSLIRQLYAVRTMRHPGILSASHIFNEKDYAYLVTAPLSGKRLRDLVRENGGRLPEATVRHIAKQLIPTVEYLHQHGFVHRNITMDTIWCDCSDPKKPKVSLSNFGLVQFVDDEEDRRMRKRVGDARYQAPEMVQGQAYNAAVDMFALGVCLYRMMSGSFPFAANYHQGRNFTEKKTSRPAFSDECWKDISVEARSFLSALLVRCWADRMWARDAIYHDWFAVELSNDVASTAGLEIDEEKENSTQLTSVASVSGTKRAEINGIEERAKANGLTLSPFLLRFLSPISSEVPISERSPVDAFASSLRQYMGSAGVSNQFRETQS